MDVPVSLPVVRADIDTIENEVADLDRLILTLEDLVKRQALPAWTQRARMARYYADEVRDELIKLHYELTLVQRDTDADDPRKER